jgi:hypothetical protein
MIFPRILFKLNQIVSVFIILVLGFHDDDAFKGSIPCIDGGLNPVDLWYLFLVFYYVMDRESVEA